MIQDHQTESDNTDAYGQFEQNFAFKVGNRQKRFKDEIYSYCNKKGHTETICFAKRDEDKMTKMC